jgi:hypothetical protein
LVSISKYGYSGDDEGWRVLWLIILSRRLPLLSFGDSGSRNAKWPPTDRHSDKGSTQEGSKMVVGLHRPLGIGPSASASPFDGDGVLLALSEKGRAPSRDNLNKI